MLKQLKKLKKLKKLAEETNKEALRRAYLNKDQWIKDTFDKLNFT